jgi:hypothetical protein
MDKPIGYKVDKAGLCQPFIVATFIGCNNYSIS